MTRKAAAKNSRRFAREKGESVLVECVLIIYRAQLFVI